MLAIPVHYLRRLQSHVPMKGRSTKNITNERRKKWLDLADALSKRAPSQSTQRTIMFLIWLANGRLDSDISHFPALPWHQSPVQTQRVDIDVSNVLGKLCPAMRFRATLR